TARENPRGILVHGAQLTATDDVPAGSVRLGRPWHPGGKPDAIGHGIVSACTIGPHVAAEPWSAMGGFAWEDARLAEHGNDWNGRSSSGPQLPAAPAPATWLDIPSPAPRGGPPAGPRTSTCGTPPPAPARTRPPLPIPRPGSTSPPPPRAGRRERSCSPTRRRASTRPSTLRGRGGGCSSARPAASRC